MKKSWILIREINNKDIGVVMFPFKNDSPAWFEEYLEKDPTREVRFIGYHGYSVHAEYLGKRITWTGKRLYKVKTCSNEILEIEEYQVTDILCPGNWND